MNWQHSVPLHLQAVVPMPVLHVQLVHPTTSGTAVRGAQDLPTHQRLMSSTSCLGTQCLVEMGRPVHTSTVFDYLRGGQLQSARCSMHLLLYRSPNGLQSISEHAARGGFRRLQHQQRHQRLQCHTVVTPTREHQGLLLRAEFNQHLSL